MNFTPFIWVDSHGLIHLGTGKKLTPMEMHDAVFIAEVCPMKPGSYNVIKDRIAPCTSLTLERVMERVKYFSEKV